MLYDERSGIAFLHYPKTGGTSFKKWFTKVFPYSQKIGTVAHSPLSKIDDLDFNKIVSLMIIRHPIDMLRSFHSFLPGFVRTKNTDRIADTIGFPKALTELPEGCAFSEFLRAFDASFPSYHEYIAIDGNVPSGVCVVRLEEINEVLPDLIRRVTMREPDCTLPRINISPKKVSALPIELTTEDLGIIRRKFAWCLNGAYRLNTRQAN